MPTFAPWRSSHITDPIDERLVLRCDAVLRIGGASVGADKIVRLAQASGRTVFRNLAEVPGCS